METLNTQNADLAEPEGQMKTLSSETASSTPYDDAWRTLSTTASQLLVPMVNEAFGEHFPDDAVVTMFPNEHLLLQQDGTSKKRITDTSFTILSPDVPGFPGERVAIVDGPSEKHYLFECESSPVGSKLLIRIVEYSVTTALDQDSATESGKLVIHIPQAAVLSLRSTKNTPDEMEIVIATEKGQVSSTVHVMKLSNYTADQILEKKLYLLIPFLLFNYEKQFPAIQNDDGKYRALLDEYQTLYRRVDELIPADEHTFSLIDTFTSKALRAMTHTVVDGLAKNYPMIREGVKSAVGGHII